MWLLKARSNTGLLFFKVPINNYQVVEKVFFHRLFKNIQMQGARNHEE